MLQSISKMFKTVQDLEWNIAKPKGIVKKLGIWLLSRCEFIRIDDGLCLEILHPLVCMIEKQLRYL